MKSLFSLAAFLIVSTLAAACSPATTTLTAVPPTSAPVVTTAPTSSNVIEPVAPPPEEQGAAWLNLPLTDARTGASFTLADFAGKTVYVEPMATWCTNCRAQQNIVRDVRNQLGDDQYVFLSLSVETDITGSDLAQYAERQNYGWKFAVMTPDFLRALTDQFGRTINNPPSTPHFIVAPDGVVSSLSTGQHSADDLVSQLTHPAGV